MKSYPLLSIIVPVYNCCEYLNECIDSIINQNYPLLEVILVDDGSNDDSGIICDNYASKYNDYPRKIIVIHKKNEGACFARRDGVLIAHADYVAFVDGDDYIDPDFAKELMTNMLLSDCDAATSGFVYTNSGTGYMDMVPEGVYSYNSKEELNDVMIYNPDCDMGGIIMSVWAKIYRRDFFVDRIKQVTERLEQFEDFAYCYSPLIDSSSVVVIHKAFYHYRDNPCSVTRKNTQDRLQEAQKSLNFERKIYAEMGEQFLKQFDLVVARFYYYYLREQADNSDIGKARLKKTIRELANDVLLKHIVDNVAGNGIKRKYYFILRMLDLKKTNLVYYYLKFSIQKDTLLTVAKKYIKDMRICR